MDVKEAVRQAKVYVGDLFSDEGVVNLGLEEVEFTDGIWEVTIGFSRPWDVPRGIAALAQDALSRRSYKVVRIDDTTGRIISVKDRERRH